MLTSNIYKQGPSSFLNSHVIFAFFFIALLSPFCFCQDFVVDFRADGICIVATITVLYYGHLCIRQYRDLTAASSDGVNNSCNWYFSDLENFIFSGPIAGMPQQCQRVLSAAHLQTTTTLGLYTGNTQTRVITIGERDWGGLTWLHLTHPTQKHLWPCLIHLYRSYF